MRTDNPWEDKALEEGKRVNPEGAECFSLRVRRPEAEGKKEELPNRRLLRPGYALLMAG